MYVCVCVKPMPPAKCLLWIYFCFSKTVFTTSEEKINEVKNEVSSKCGNQLQNGYMLISRAFIMSLRILPTLRPYKVLCVTGRMLVEI